MKKDVNKINVKGNKCMKNSIEEKEVAFLYCRVSTKEKYSIELQETEAVKYAKAHNFELLIWTDFCIQSDVETNVVKKLDNMIKFVTSNRVKNILFYSKDIITNDYNILEIQEFINKKDNKIHFIKENKIYDKNSSFYRDFILNKNENSNKNIILLNEEKGFKINNDLIKGVIV